MGAFDVWAVAKVTGKAIARIAARVFMSSSKSGKEESELDQF
jgi:hypothetical protein